MRVVVDTSVWVSGIFWTGLPHRLLLRWRDGEFDVIVSPALLAELSRALHTVARRIGADPKLADEWATLVALAGDLVIPSETVTACIVSGDRDLLALREYGGVRIVSVREFVGMG